MSTPKSSGTSTEKSTEDFQPIASWERHGDFLKSIIDLLFKNVVFAPPQQTKVVLWQSPSQLGDSFDFELNQNGVSHEKLLLLIKNTIKFSVKTGHPYFINQLFSGLDPYGLAGQWLTDALNASVYTYEVAPVFTLMETHVIKEMCRMLGPEWGDGLFCPGGSTANGIAINLARFQRMPQIKKVGCDGFSRCVIFASNECHYSIYKFAAFMGFGEENVISVSTDDVGQIRPEDLDAKIRQEIEKAAIPIAVIATLGTTVRGAFDPVNAIAVICRKYGIWLHVDAAWGGSLLFSQRHRSLLAGIEQADSVVINPHKLLAVPQQCSILLVRSKDILHRCHSYGADYLFQSDKYYDGTYDTGDKYLQCGRKCDVFKFWFMWKAKGSSGFARHIDSLMDLAEYFEQQVSNRVDFLMVSRRQYMNVCFWYLPRCIQVDKSKIPDLHSEQLHKVAPQIKAVMVKHGSVMLSYQPLKLKEDKGQMKRLPNFFRFVSQNSALTRLDIDYILDHIAEIGSAIFK